MTEEMNQSSSPSAADLDVIAAEQAAKDATGNPLSAENVAAEQRAHVALCDCNASGVPHRHTSEGIVNG